MVLFRFIGHGSSYQSLSAEFTCGERTVSAVVDEVTEAVIKVLFGRAFPRLVRRDFEDIAHRTQARYDYPRAIGFMDGKHVAIKKPAHSGSGYFNYMKFHSIILLACCDCDYNIIAFDVGAPGRAGDAGVFRTSDVKRWMEENESSFPETRELGEVGPVQFHFLVDSGFGQDFRLVRPYPNQGDGDMSRMRFNRKHSGARRLIESTFGILCRRFAVLQKPVELNPVKTSRLVISLMVLHNLVARRKDALRDVERYPPYEGALASLQNEEGSDGAGSAVTARDKIKQHYDQLYGI
ncbi:hypothetical protein Aduo_006412 [Ancylostoma duodenale]